jgi:hypothetical protein
MTLPLIVALPISAYIELCTEARMKEERGVWILIHGVASGKPSNDGKKMPPHFHDRGGEGFAFFMRRSDPVVHRHLRFPGRMEVG